MIEIETRNMQVFPSGEVRTFHPDAENVWRLTEHTRAPGDTSASLIGTALDDMPAPFVAEGDE